MQETLIRLMCHPSQLLCAAGGTPSTDWTVWHILGAGGHSVHCLHVPAYWGLESHGCSGGIRSWLHQLGPRLSWVYRSNICGFQNFHCQVLDFTRTLLWTLAAAKASDLNHTKRAALSDTVEIPKLSVPMCYAFNHQHNCLLFPQEGLLSPGLLPPKDLFRHSHTVSAETGSKATKKKKQSYIRMSRGHTK